MKHKVTGEWKRPANGTFSYRRAMPEPLMLLFGVRAHYSRLLGIKDPTNAARLWAVEHRPAAAAGR